MFGNVVIPSHGVFLNPGVFPNVLGTKGGAFLQQ